jgi:cytochrome P450
VARKVSVCVSNLTLCHILPALKLRLTTQNRYEHLKQEVAEADAEEPSGSYNVQSLRYLDAVVREGLRISMANPTRFPRVVPKGGWTFSSTAGQTYHFSEHTMVSCQPYTLHHNPAIFPEPFEFRPERWLEDPTPEMQRDAFPFGLGARQCIARNLAQFELLLAVRAIARESLLDGAKAVGERIEIKEWFNSVVVGEKVELVWE